MALTLTQRTDEFEGLYLRSKLVTFDSSYPTGGEPLTPADLGFADPAASLVVFVMPATGRTFEYDAANQKIKAFSTAVTEVTNATDLSAVVTQVFAWGKKPI